MTKLKEIIRVGLEVFRHIDKFNIWPGTPNLASGNQKPIDLLKDSNGMELVLAELTRINDGILV